MPDPVPVYAPVDEEMLTLPLPVDELHVPPAGVQVAVPLPVLHTTNVPAMLPAAAFTVTVDTDIHPLARL